MRSNRSVAGLVSCLLLAALLLVPSVAWADGSATDAFLRFLQKGPVVALGASFVAGVLASLTPCVFPMVPITVAIFGATESKSRARGLGLSATFVLGMATLFTPFGVGAALSGTLLGSTLANPWVTVSLAALFFALASSMFGAFEMALPSSMNNKLSTVGGVGFKGAFVLGLVMGLIAAPCTGPFLTGMVAWIATTKNVALGLGAMFCFALGLGVPFFAAGGFAVSLPKGGAWMLGIKWASGVALAYMALAYLRDGFAPVRALLLPSTTFGAVTGALFVVGLVLGTVHVAAERRKSPIAHLSKPMKLASILPAIVGAFLFLSWVNMPKGPRVAWRYDEAVARADAVAQKKPVILDFGAEWCEGCRNLDKETWPDPRVRQEAARFITIKGDATDADNEETKRLVEKYAVGGLPTVIVLDSTGAEKVRFNEFVDAERLTAAVKDVM